MAMYLEECTATEYRHPSGCEMIRLQNRDIGVTVIPKRGAEIHCFENRKLAIDVLWKAPWGLRLPYSYAAAGGASSEMTWMDHFAGGWQGIFPNAGSDCIYRGAHHNFHGESSVIPWNYSISRTQNGVSVDCETVLARSPFRMRRCIELHPDHPVLYIRETITNYGIDAMPFVWGHHPALGAPFLSSDCVLQIPAKGFREGSSAKVVTRNGAEPQPIAAPNADLSCFGYFLDFDAGWYSVFNRQLDLGFALAWPLEVFPCAWLWQEFGGTKEYPWYGAACVMAVEPFTTASDRGLAHAAETRTARVLGPGESLQTELAALLYRGARDIRSFDLSGELHSK